MADSILFQLPDPTKVTGWTNVAATLDHVHDGDTLTANVVSPDGCSVVKIPVRVDAIDAPEDTPSMGLNQPYGPEATQHLRDLIAGQPGATDQSISGSPLILNLAPTSDVHNRASGFVSTPGSSDTLNYQMVADGYAWVYDPYAKKSLSGQPGEYQKYLDAQAQAQTDKAGLWADPNAQRPSVYRAEAGVSNTAKEVRVTINIQTSDGGALTNPSAFRNAKQITVSGSSVSDVLDPKTDSAQYRITATGYSDATVSVSRTDPQVVQNNQFTATVTLTKSGAATPADTSEPNVITDSGSANITNEKAAAAGAQSPVNLASISLPKPPDPETVGSNMGYSGYFTSAQTRLYIGSLFIDELHTIEWALNQNIVPVFGYASRDADAFAEGRALVQGQLILNYTAPWYLGVALQKHFQDASQEDNGTLDSDQEAQALQVAQAIISGGSINGVSRPVLQRAKQLINMGQFAYRDTSPAVYKKLTFNMILEFGDDPKNRRMIENCKLNSCSVLVDQSGNPIFESYGFIGRRVR